MDDLKYHWQYLRGLAQKISIYRQETYIKAAPKFKEDHNFLIVSRHWNSETPIVPRKLRNDPDFIYQLAGSSLGGGYLIISNGIGIAVDPGYNFLQILYTVYRISINDIHVVFVTHDHPDHFADLINIITLKRISSNKSLELYLSKEVFKSFQYFFKKDGNCFALLPNQTIKLNVNPGSIEVNTLKAYHNERMYPILNSPTALGLLFKIKNHKNSDTYNIAITGDTQFPSKYKKYLKKYEEFIDNDINQFSRQYTESKIDIICMHIGSIEKDFENINEKTNLEHIRYQGFHLGLNGCRELLKILNTKREKPLIAIITEFGIELKGHRVDIAKILDSLQKNPSIVIPADLELTIDFSDFKKERFLCNKCRQLRSLEGKNFPDESMFHEIFEISFYEDSQLEFIRYQGSKMVCGLSYVTPDKVRN